MPVILNSPINRKPKNKKKLPVCPHTEQYLNKINDLGESRLGRKLYLKATDAHHKHFRTCAYSKYKAVSGPPIPNSEKNGQRRFYTLKQAKAGGFVSSKVRRTKAQPDWDKAKEMHDKGISLRKIGKALKRSFNGIKYALDTMKKEALRKLQEEAYMDKPTVQGTLFPIHHPRTWIPPIILETETPKSPDTLRLLPTASLGPRYVSEYPGRRLLKAPKDFIKIVYWVLRDTAMLPFMEDGPDKKKKKKILRIQTRRMDAYMEAVEAYEPGEAYRLFTEAKSYCEGFGPDTDYTIGRIATSFKDTYRD